MIKSVSGGRLPKVKDLNFFEFQSADETAWMARSGYGRNYKIIANGRADGWSFTVVLDCDGAVKRVVPANSFREAVAIAQEDFSDHILRALSSKSAE